MCKISQRLPSTVNGHGKDTWCRIFSAVVRSAAKCPSEDKILLKYACTLAKQVDTGRWTLCSILDLEQLCRYFSKKDLPRASELKKISEDYLRPALAAYFADEDYEE